MDEAQKANQKDEMALANIEMFADFDRLYDAMSNEQRLAVIALVSLIDHYRMRAGYKQFCRMLVTRLKNGELIPA
jgi:hypothetical protein